MLLGGRFGRHLIHLYLTYPPDPILNKQIGESGEGRHKGTSERNEVLERNIYKEMGMKMFQFLSTVPLFSTKEQSVVPHLSVSSTAITWPTRVRNRHVVLCACRSFSLVPPVLSDYCTIISL